LRIFDFKEHRVKRIAEGKNIIIRVIESFDRQVTRIKHRINFVRICEKESEKICGRNSI